MEAYDMKLPSGDSAGVDAVIRAMKEDVASWCPPSLVETDYSSPEIGLVDVVDQKVWRATFQWARLHSMCLFIQMVRYGGQSILWLKEAPGLPTWDQEIENVEDVGAHKFKATGWIERIILSLGRRRGPRIPLTKGEVNALASCRVKHLPQMLSMLVINGYCLPRLI